MLSNSWHMLAKLAQERFMQSFVYSIASVTACVPDYCPCRLEVP